MLSAACHKLHRDGIHMHSEPFYAEIGVASESEVHLKIQSCPSENQIELNPTKQAASLVGYRKPTIVRSVREVMVKIPVQRNDRTIFAICYEDRAYCLMTYTESHDAFNIRG